MSANFNTLKYKNSHDISIQHVYNAHQTHLKIFSSIMWSLRVIVNAFIRF